MTDTRDLPPDKGNGDAMHTLQGIGSPPTVPKADPQKDLQDPAALDQVATSETLPSGNYHFAGGHFTVEHTPTKGLPPQTAGGTAEPIRIETIKGLDDASLKHLAAKGRSSTDPLGRVPGEGEISDEERALMATRETLPVPETIKERADVILPSDDVTQVDEGISTAQTMVATATPREPAASDTNLFVNLTKEHKGRYETKNDIGRGGIGKVVCALDTHIGREVAVKELLPAHQSKVDTSSSSSKSLPNLAELRFLNEARITGYLEHPGIVPVYEVGHREDGTIYYTMKLVRGTTMADKLKNTSLKERLLLLPNFIDVCNAMAYAHNHGVIHRDLKPDNIMLGKFGETLVLDWGLAKMRELEDLSKGSLAKEIRALKESMGAETMNGQPMGTPPYMPPEQARGEVDQIDERTDVYTLGAILYEILTGRPPHTGTNALTVLLSVLEDPITPPLELNPHVPPELSAIAMKALQKEKDQRYKNAMELASDVQSFLSGGLVGTYHYSGLEMLKRWITRNRTRLAILMVLLVAVLSSWWYRGYRLRMEARQHELSRVARTLDEVSAIIKKASSEEPKGEKWFEIYAFKLISLSEPVVVDRLISELSGNPNTSARRLAARALGGMRNTRALFPLMDRLKKGQEKDRGVIIEIINALGILGDARANTVVKEARWRDGLHGHVWNSTQLAYRMIPAPPLSQKEGDDAKALYEQGQSLKNKKEMDKAEAYLKRAIKKNPALKEAYKDLGSIYKYQERYAKAITFFTKAIELDPEYLAAYNNRGLTWSSMDYYERALEDISKAVSLAPKHPAIRLNRASIYISLGRLDDAELDLKRAIALRPSSAKYRLNLGRLYLYKGNIEAAKREFSHSIKLRPDYVWPYLELAEVFVLKGDLSSASATLDKVDEIDPRDVNLICWRVRIALRENRLAQAEKELARLHKIDLKNQLPSFFRAFTFEFAAGHHKKALTLAQSALAHPLDDGSRIGHSLNIVSLTVRSGDLGGWRTYLENLPKSNHSRWNGVLAQYLLGRLSEHHLMERAKSPQRLNDAYYYIGLRHEIAGNRTLALRMYTKVVSGTFIANYEYLFAQAAIKELTPKENTR